MAIFLKPDKTITTNNGLKIKQKIIPDSLVAEKDIASWIKKGQKMKPCKKLNNGTGKPLGITVHNTGDIKVASETNAAEQYTRATYNGNMSGVVVHFYVWDDEIWQNLDENERGWHATDGQTRRKSQRNDGSKIGGNLDTIAIECIGNRTGSEDTTARLVAYLCDKYNLSPSTDVYTHNYFYPQKNCPQYIRPHWSAFLNKVKKYYNEIASADKTEIAVSGEIVKLNSYKVRILCDVLNIRNGAGIGYKINGTVKKGDVFTIVAEKGTWGKLKSGAGWISLKENYVERVV